MWRPSNAFAARPGPRWSGVTGIGACRLGRAQVARGHERDQHHRAHGEELHRDNSLSIATIQSEGFVGIARRFPVFRKPPRV